MKTRESPKNQDSTCDLQGFCTFLAKVEDDPRVDTHILVQGFGRKQGQMQNSENKYISHNSLKLKVLLNEKTSMLAVNVLISKR